MRKAVERFFDWIFHPSIRRDPLPRGKALLYRYPTPGSNMSQEAPKDYRTPFSDTDLNVRYAHFTHYQTEEGRSELQAASHSLSPLKKLVLLGFLKENEQGNSQAVEEAKKKFKATYNIQVEDIAYKNDFQINIPQGQDREAIRSMIAESIASSNLENEVNYLSSTEHELSQHPNQLKFQSLDLFDAPHLQQGRIENDYALDKISHLRADAEGGIDVKKGQASFWKALDDSNSEEAVKKVQEKVGDRDPNNFDLRNTKVKFEFDNDGNVVDIHRIK